MGIEKDMAYAYKDSFIGKIEKVLVEETISLGGKTYQVGHNERYVKLAFESDVDHINEIVSVKVVDRLNKELMLGEITD